MARYGDLSRGAELAADWDKVLEWQKKTRAAKQALYKSNKKTAPRVTVKRTMGYIRPFNNTTGLLVFERKIPKSGQTSTAADNITQLLAIAQGGTNGAGRIMEVQPTGSGIIIVQKARYKFAKIHCITVLKEEDKTSRVTQNAYKKIVTDTVSTPFGRGNATETFAEALLAIEGSSAYTTFIQLVIAGTDATNRVLITPEGS